METKNLRFLGVINGIYDELDVLEAADFNIFSNLLVYADEHDDVLIKYKELYYDNTTGLPQTTVNEGEFWLNEGEVTLSLIILNFNEPMIKELIFAKFNDHLDRSYFFAKIK